MMKYQEIINRLTLEEKAALMSGKSVWETKDYPEKGIPSIFCLMDHMEFASKKVKVIT